MSARTAADLRIEMREKAIELYGEAADKHMEGTFLAREAARLEFIADLLTDEQLLEAHKLVADEAANGTATVASVGDENVQVFGDGVVTVVPGGDA